MKIIFILLFPLYLFSQNTLLNESKYWVMRDRLVNDFMIPGECNGCGIVIKKRGHVIDTEWPVNSGNWVGGGFDISDEGFELGEYLIVLASEWRLLYQSGLDRSKTELELYYALRTIDRLDYSAEFYWSQFGHWYNHPENPYGSTNGFLIRDDVFENFISKEPVDYDNAYKHYQYLNQGADGKTGKYQKQNILKSNGNNYILSLEESNNMGLYYNNSCFSGASAGIHDSEYPQTSQYSYSPECNDCTGPREFSQDNNIGLLMGLVAVNRLVENWATHSENRQTIHFAQFASDRIDRIIHQIRNNAFTVQDNWVIDNPVTGKCVKGIHWTEYLTNTGGKHCVDGGADAGFFSGQFAEIHNKYTSTNNINGQWFSGWGLDPSINIDYFNISSAPTAFLSSIFVTLNGSRPNEKAVKWIDKYNKTNDFMFLDLLYVILHEGYPLPTYSNGATQDKTERGLNYYKNMFNNMPCFSTEYNTSTNFLVNNYLQVMTSYNLYKLLIGEKYKIDKNDNTNYPRLETHVSISHDVPHGGGSTHMVIEPICNETVEALYNINSRAHISYYYGNENEPTIHYGDPCAANITYKAGHSIKLLPGFKTEAGTHFLAQIEDFGQCNIIQGQYNFWEHPDIGNENESLFIISDIYNYKKQYLANKKNYLLSNNISCKISPNPTKDKLNINFSNSDTYTVSIYKTTGEKIFKKTLYCNQLKIDLTNNNAGVYILEIINSDGEIRNEKIIKQ